MSHREHEEIFSTIYDLGTIFLILGHSFQVI